MRTSLILLLLAVCGAAPLRSQSTPDAEAALLRDLGRLHTQTNDQRVDAMAAMLRERGIAFEVQEFENLAPTRDPRPRGRNLIVTLGSGPRDIVIGAHLDAVHLPGGTLSPGMTDNGAGSMVLLRLAEQLRQTKHGHRLRLVFFDLEEAGLLGSRAYVRAQPEGRTAAMINLDIVGYGDAIIFGPASNAGNETVYAAMHRTCGKQRLVCVEYATFPNSDDRSFQAAGIPNISLATQPRAEAYQFWLMMHAAGQSGLREGFTPRIMQIIHTPNDTMEHIQPGAMLLMQRAVTELVRELDATLAATR